MTDIKFCYADGSKLEKNDKVLVAQSKVARVEDILIPGTKKAEEYSCLEGGFILVFEDGDVQVWNNTDEDISLIERGTGKLSPA